MLFRLSLLTLLLAYCNCQDYDDTTVAQAVVVLQDIVIANIANPPHGCPNYGLCTETAYYVVNFTDTTETLEYICDASDCVCVNGTTNGTTNCDTITDMCSSDPCPNSNYTCTTSGINSYSCACSTGYTGSSCQYDSTSACGSSPCQNGGTCKNTNTSYTCTCSKQYTGTNCETQNLCYDVNCNNGTCSMVLDDSNFYCNCSSGYQGTYCNVSTTTVVAPTYSNCWVFTSTSLSSYAEKFSDSKMTIEMCQAYANSFTPPYTEIFLCETWCAVANYDLLNSTAKGVLSLPSGCSSKCPGNTSEICGDYATYAVSYVNNPEVVDPNGCTDSTLCNANLGQGVCVDQASSTGTNYTCTCSAYYTGSDCNTTVASACDTNPCNTGTCNLISQTNTYTCTCPSGYSGSNCQYENVCTSETCLYGGTCTETSSGGYTCACLQYYSGTNCENIDRCNYSDPCVHGTCNSPVNYISPNYTCTCKAGYNGTNCDTVINFCDSTPCYYGSTCNPYFGGYNCTCLTGLSGYNCSTIIDQCEVQAVKGVSPCNTKDTKANCTTGINNFTCSCSSEWTDTLCDLSMIIKTVLMDIYGYVDTDMISMLDDLLANPSEIKDLVPFITGLLSDSEREALSWDVEDLFYWIAFEDKRLDMYTDIYKWNDVVLGNCFTFNHYDNNITYLMRNDGKHGGIYANMRCRQDEYAPWYDTASINVFIHTRDEYVFSESVRYNAPPNAKSNINIYSTYYTRLGGKYGVCVTKTSEVKDYYYPLGYTTDGCLRTCYQDMIYAACDCMDPRYPQANNVTTCQLANRTCVTDASDAAGDPSTWSSCVCPLPCSNEQFSVTWSKADFVSNPVSCQSATNQTACLDTYQDSLLVSIVLPRLDYQIYAESANMDFNKFLSQLGGQLGVLMGINIVSFIELVFLTVMLFSTCCKKYN